MAAWLEHAECQLQAVDQVFFCSGMMELKALPFYTITKQDHQGKLGRFYSSDSDYVQHECLIDGICEFCCYGMASGLRVTVEFLNDGFLDVWLFMKIVGIEQRLGFSKDK